MVVERKLVVGLDDIKRVYFECKECQARSVFSPRSLQRVPRNCQGCNAPFILTPVYEESLAVKFIDSLQTMKKATDTKLRILFELDEPDPHTRAERTG